MKLKYKTDMKTKDGISKWIDNPDQFIGDFHMIIVCVVGWLVGWLDILIS